MIPSSVQALLNFHVRGYYKQKNRIGSETSASQYIESLEKVTEDLKEVVRGLYREREALAKRIEAFVQRWDEPLNDLTVPTDPSEYVSGL